MKKGFTLIELLSVTIILAVILVVAVPKILKIIDNVKIEAFKKSEISMVNAAKLYMTTNVDSLPIEEGNSTEITLSVLQQQGLIKTINSPEDKSKVCNGYIMITKIRDNEYEYIPHLNCINNIGSSIENGLVGHYTFDDYQESTKNLIPNSPTNSYPTVGNGHSTYNTNQYNNNTYFSIGVIESVQNNIVTLSSIGRTINTYDVLNPQTTGGGLTAGVSYFIKKHSANSFSIHQYNSSQDGSQGFRVHDSINNDVRININATNFPTMWFGAPHLPNSALVKEIIPNGFSKDGIIHDCIRLHTEHKPQGEVDGMAYNVSPTVVQGKTYTFSFYYRAVNVESIGTYVKLGLHTGSGWPGSNTQKIVQSTDWQRYELTSIAPNSGGTSMYFWPTKGATIDISEIQCEEKFYSTPFTISERIGIVKDYSGNNNNASLTLLTTPSWKKEGKLGLGSYLFNGSNDIVVNNNDTLNTNIKTVSAWIKPNALPAATHQRLVVKNGTNGYMLNIYGNTIEAYMGGQIVNGVNINVDEWVYAVATIEDSRLKFYINGNLVSNQLYTGTLNGGTTQLTIGSENSMHYFNGYIDEVKIYRRELDQEEIKHIYNIEKS